MTPIKRGGARGKATAEPRECEFGAGLRFAARGPIEAYDEYSDDMVALQLGQADPGKIEGLLIDFRYRAGDGEVTRRLLLCYQCGRNEKHIYVRGYCPFREELRTFRVDRIYDLIALQGAREISIADPKGFFAAFAAAPTEELDVLYLDAPMP